MSEGQWRGSMSDDEIRQWLHPDVTGEGRVPPSRWERATAWYEDLFVQPGGHLTKFGWLIVSLVAANAVLDVVKWLTAVLVWVVDQ